MKTTKLTRLVALRPRAADSMVSTVLRETDGEMKSAARILRVSTRTLYRVLAKRKQPRELARRLQAGIR